MTEPGEHLPQAEQERIAELQLLGRTRPELMNRTSLFAALSGANAKELRIVVDSASGGLHREDLQNTNMLYLVAGEADRARQLAVDAGRMYDAMHFGIVVDTALNYACRTQYRMIPGIPE